MNDIYNIMSHHHQPDPVAINGNLEESIPIIFPALIDYDHVNPIFLNHLPSPLEYYDHDFQHNNDHADQRTTAVVVVGGVGDATAHDHDLSFWGGDDDDDHEKASAGTLESLVDQATRLVPTCPVSAITYYGGNIFKMINDDDMISTCFGYNPQQIISNMATTTTTTAVNDILVLTNDTHGLKIEHRSRKEKEEEIYAVNNEAVEKDNYAEAVEIEHRQASLFTYVAATTSTQSSVVPDHHTQREGSKKTEKCSTTSSTNQRSKTTILHNKVERKRRNKINQRMEALKRLVPDICHKTDKATIIDQVIEYIKKLQNERDQLKMMSSYGMNNNMKNPMIIPMSSYYMYMHAQQQQQQHQMSMMADDAQMGMGVDLGSMHTNPIMHPNLRSTSYWN